MAVGGDLGVVITGAWGVGLLWGIVVVSACPVLGRVGRHVNFLFMVKPLRLLPMVVMGFWRGFVMSSFGGGLVASAWVGLVPTIL